ncbi:MAG TPA: DinB family protein [Candidatus Sulfotelmatobacter sp.]|nr:DinB family protein [Candidatus Sulfotelmatobacter sp.]
MHQRFELFDQGVCIVELLEHLRRQFLYDAWANREVLAAIKDAGSGASPVRPLQLLAHILSAERLWLERIRRQPQSLPVWPEFNLEQCETETSELAELWGEYFAQLSSSALSEKVTYKNSKGEAWSSTVKDVLTHVAMHSAYHRGQIASLMRAGGRVPAYTDFIHAVRQGFIE